MSSERYDVDNPLPVVDSVLFQLGIALNLSTGGFYRRFAKKYKISLVDWQVLLLAVSRPGLSPNEVSKMIAVDKMTITRSVRRLVARKCIRASSHPHDRRRLALTILPKGAAIYDAIAPNAGAHQEEALHDLSEAQRLMLRELVLKLVATLRRIADEETEKAPRRPRLVRLDRARRAD